MPALELANHEICPDGAWCRQKSALAGRFTAARSAGRCVSQQASSSTSPGRRQVASNIHVKIRARPHRQHAQMIGAFGIVDA